MLSKSRYTLLIIAFLSTGFVFAQENEEVVKDSVVAVNTDKAIIRYNPLSPAKAAFYSAVLPGLGQAYNKKYWKIPFVYGAIGSGIYFYSINNTNYNRVREAYKRRISGRPDEYDGLDGNPLLSINALTAAQKSLKKDRDLSLLVTIGFYVLQIIEASANAHLLQHNVDDKLSFNPQLFRDSNTQKTVVGATLNFNF